MRVYILYIGTCREEEREREKTLYVLMRDKWHVLTLREVIREFNIPRKKRKHYYWNVYEKYTRAIYNA